MKIFSFFTVLFRALTNSILLTCVLAGGVAHKADAGDIDPALISALRQSTQSIHEQKTDLNSLTWLTSMSTKIQRRIKNPFYRVRLLKAVNAEAKLAGLDPQLVLAVIDIESNFDRYAISSAGAQGLMQVMPFWKEIHGSKLDDLLNPLVNLRYGCIILRHYLDKYDNRDDALAAYNGSLGSPKYSDKVLRHFKKHWQIKKDIYARTLDERFASF